MSSRQRNTAKYEDHSRNNLEIYTIGTMMAGTDRSLEDSISGYTPIMIDRRGNRRFHGAFTGGFSAGHFNTVGSAQGYKAKYETWSSSRNSKNKQSIQQTPMDFMDDEDMATNTNLLMTSKPFNSLNNTSMDIFHRTKTDVSKQFGDTMGNYLMPDKNAVFNHTKGIQLLKKCGWRTGKNIGDQSNITRLKLLLRKQDELLLNNRTNDLLFGNHILNTDTNDDEQTNEHRMVSIYRPQMKTDVHGIGYDADNEDNDELHQDSEGPKKKKRKLLVSARHGLSALEDTEVGDDVYGDDVQPHSGYNTFIPITHSDDDDIVLMDDKHRKSIRHQTYNNNKRRHRHSVSACKKDERMRSKDGTLPIDGFVVSCATQYYEYNLKQQIQRNNYRKNRNNYRSDYSGFKQFKSTKMEIDKDFVHKFASIDLTVGSFLCRDKASHTKRSTAKVLTDTSCIPQIVPNAQEQEPRHVSHDLQSRFTAEETMASEVTLSGLRAGLTLSTHIPGKTNTIHKAQELLNDIRSIFGNENAEKLLRFDVFLADILGIESPMDTDNNVLFDDGNKTQFELNKERYEFKEKWQELEKYKEYLYQNKPRLHKKEIRDTSTLVPARTVEMWIPDRLLCKRCNIKDPYEGMYSGKQQETKSTKSTKSGVDKRRDQVVHMNMSKGEHIAAMLRDNESDKEPPILQLKQLKTWNAYLQETEHKENMDHRKRQNKEEMRSFIDGILNDSDASDDGDGNRDDNIKKVDAKKQEISLFKSIFEDNECTESDTEDSGSDGDAEDTDVTMTMPSINNVEDKEKPLHNEGDVIHVAIKENVIHVNEEKEDQVIMTIPRQRKKFKFIAKAQRECKNVNSTFGSIGIVDKRRNERNIDSGKVDVDQVDAPVVQQFKIQHESDDCVDDVHEVKPMDTMIWKVVDNDSSESSRDIDRDEHRRKKKRKKRKKKKSKKKSKRNRKNCDRRKNKKHK